MLKKLMLMSICALTLSSFTPKDNSSKDKKNSELFLLIGTYTSGTSKGIYVYRFNTETGDASYVNEIDGLSNPSYLNLSKDEKFVYSVGENENEGGVAYALSFDKKNGKLTRLNSQKTFGGSPCYINIDPKGKYVITANYTGGNVSVFKIKKDGTLFPSNQIISFSGAYSEDDPTIALINMINAPDYDKIFASLVLSPTMGLWSPQNKRIVCNKKLSLTAKGFNLPLWNNRTWLTPFISVLAVLPFP